MNYDSITGLPLEASFLAYAEYSCEHQVNYPYYILAMRFPILNQKDFIFEESNRNFLLSSAVHKLIRNHNYMKTAYRRENDDTIVILLDESLMANHDVSDELQKAFMCFSTYCQKAFSDATIHIHAGLYHITASQVSIEQAISNAIMVLNTIKSTEPTKFLFFKESVLETKKAEEKILPAIEDNWKNDHVIVYLQPKFNLKTNEMAGAEALVRIIDTDGHLTKPGFFLPILQKNNMSCEMDLMVTEKILRLLNTWNNVGISPLPISVNLSENTLYEPLFTSIFLELMEKYKEVQRYLRIEISENTYLRNPYHINHMIDLFHSYGCMIELDDFGKSLMTYTRDTMPHVDFVKLSSAFLSMAVENHGQKEFFDKYMNLLNQVNIPCISECVEKQTEVDFLLEHNIPFAQGFYFSRPVPFDIFQKKFLTYTFINV